jgi:NADPH:quinone reductase
VNTRAVVIEGFDDVPHVEEIAVPELGDDGVLIRVHAASVNVFDWKAAGGMFKDTFDYRFPVTIGRDYAGVVEQVGPAVRRVEPGQAVFGYFTGMTLGSGAFSERIRVAEADCFVAKPEELSFTDATCLPLCGIVAYRLVDAVDPKPGETHLVLGAPGGVGTFAVQLLHARGARVIASGLPEDGPYLRSLGADEVVDYRDGVVDSVRAGHPEGIDGLIDVVSYAPQFAANVAMLHPGARAASTHRSADPETLDPAGITGVNVHSGPDASLLARVGDDAASGALRVFVEQVFPLEEGPAALDQLKTGHTRGKYVLAAPE